MAAAPSLRAAGALALLGALAAGAAANGPPRQDAAAPEVLTPVAALPAHVAGTFQDVTACHQGPGGDYFVFDRRAHSVYTVSPGLDTARKLIEIGTEPGRVLDPTAFSLADDGTFVVADAPRGRPRIQIFTTSGASLGGFYLEGRAVPRVTLRTLVLSGIASVEYTGRSLFVSQPESGAIVTEYGADGRAVRAFGELRRTGHEAEANVHLALNSALVSAHPDGGFYVVFLAGVPQFRKYDAGGQLVFERHIEGPELDAFVQSLPTTWKPLRTEAGEIPLVLPSVYAAAADPQGNLWVSLAPGVTYVYDASGGKRRVVRFRAAGFVSPTGLSFTRKGRVLVTPGCYAFAAR